MIFNFKKPITQEVIEPTIDRTIELTEEAFLDFVIRYETGKLGGTELLIFFCYVIQNEKWERYRYEWCIEMMDYGILTDQGTVNPQKLMNYNNSKIKTKF